MSKPAIDLHLHSYYSDGAESPETIVARAKAQGYKAIALTDHDGVNGVPEFLKAAQKAGLKGIPGIELSAYYSMPNPFNPIGTSRRYYMHILGYGIDPNNKQLLRILEKIQAQRSERNEKMRQWLVDHGIPMTDAELTSYSREGYIGKMSFARLMVDRGMYPDVETAVADKEYLGNSSFRAIRRDKIDAGRAIDAIKSAGGLAFVAHPYQITYDGWKMDSPASYKVNQEMVISALTADGLDGLECYYSDHTAAQSAAALDLAKYLNILVSRGSDDHGENMRPVKKMSKFAAEPDPKLLSWIDKL